MKILPSIEIREEQLKEYPTAWMFQFSEISDNNRFAKSKSISSKIGIVNFYLESTSDLATYQKLCEKILPTTGFAS